MDKNFGAGGLVPLTEAQAARSAKKYFLNALKSVTALASEVSGAG